MKPSIPFLTPGALLLILVRILSLRCKLHVIKLNTRIHFSKSFQRLSSLSPTISVVVQKHYGFQVFIWSEVYYKLAANNGSFLLGFCWWAYYLSDFCQKAMASGDWFKAIISRKNTKPGRLKQLKGPPKELPTGSKGRNKSNKSSKMFYNGSSDRLSIENVAATHIQAAYRGYLARKKLHYFRKTNGLQVLAKRDPIKRQTSITLRYIQSWSKVQAEVRARRVCMVKEGRVKQKKQENQLKLDAKLHDLEVEWCGGSETMEEVLARIHQREEAAVKRERAMAYAFSHQWKAHPGTNFGQFSYAFEKENWGWSWMERWLAARPWELRVSFSQKAQPKASINTVKSTNQPNRRAVGLVKPPLSTAKMPSQKKPQLADEKAVTHEQNHSLMPTEIGDVISYPLHARVMETEGGR